MSGYLESNCWDTEKLQLHYKLWQTTHARVLYPAKLSLTIYNERKTFHNRNNFKQFEFTNTALQKALEGKFPPEEKVKLYQVYPWVHTQKKINQENS